MRMISVTLLLIAGLTLSACHSENEKKVMAQDAISHGFNCVTPLSPDQIQLPPGIEIAQLYQETAAKSGKFVPKGWQIVTQGTYQGCYVPAMGHVGYTTIKP